MEDVTRHGFEELLFFEGVGEKGEEEEAEFALKWGGEG